MLNRESRENKVIGFKAYHDCDYDILNWWEAMPVGERSHVLRTLIRAYLSGQITPLPEGEQATLFASSVQLAQMQADTVLIRDSILQLPKMLEQFFAGIQVATVPTPTPQMQVGVGKTALSAAEAESRASRMKKAQW